MPEKESAKTVGKSRPRPLSPHLQVYKPQLTSVLSITHRATGVALYIGVIFFALFLYAYAFLPDFELVGWLTSNEDGIKILKTIFVPYSFALYFHFCTGIRHLFWDMGYGYSIETAYKSGYMVILCSLVFTALTWITVFLG